MDVRDDHQCRQQPTPGPTFYAGHVQVAGTLITHTAVFGVGPFGPGTVQPRHAHLSPDRDRLTLATPPGQVLGTSIRLTWQRAARAQFSAGR